MGASLSQREVLVRDRTVRPRPQAPQIVRLNFVFCWFFCILYLIFCILYFWWSYWWNSFTGFSDVDVGVIVFSLTWSQSYVRHKLEILFPGFGFECGPTPERCCLWRTRGTRKCHKCRENDESVHIWYLPFLLHRYRFQGLEVFHRNCENQLKRCQISEVGPCPKSSLENLDLAPQRLEVPVRNGPVFDHQIVHCAEIMSIVLAVRHLAPSAVSSTAINFARTVNFMWPFKWATHFAS